MNIHDSLKQENPRKASRGHPWLIGIFLLIVVGVVWEYRTADDRKPKKKIPSAFVHPVFHTPITGESSARPAIQVDVLDASESWFGDAELYLAVQSSRFPESAWILLPINVGDFEGCRSRFVQLPFEVSPEDNLLFNLLDEDSLTEEDERLLVGSCRAAGYCVLIAGSAYAPQLARGVAPVAGNVSEILGDAVVSGLTMSKFDNFGWADYIVPDNLPSQPHEANQLTTLDDANHARVQLRIYGPTTPLDGISPDLTLNQTPPDVLRTVALR